MTDEEYRAEFDRVWPWLERAIIANGAEPDKDALWRKISSQEVELWTSKNAALTTGIYFDDYGVKEIRGLLQGGDLGEIKKIEPVVCAWAKSIGCKRATMIGRKALIRVFSGYRQRAIMISKEL